MLCELCNVPQALSEAGHSDDGTHRLDDPVSKSTEKFCGGVPMVMLP